MASHRCLTLAVAVWLVGGAGPSAACDVAERFRAGFPATPASLASPSAPQAPRAGRAAFHADVVDVPSIVFVRHDLDSGDFGQVTEGINVGDIDGDGRPDIVEGGDQFLIWYHNPDWTPHLIADGYKFAGGAMVVVRDMDGDGRVDVLTGRYPLGSPEARETIWYANTPDGWQEHVLSQTAFCHDLAFADFDGDGIVDAACDDQFLDQIVWLAGPMDPTAEWESNLIDARRAMGADVGDIDGDGRPDVVAGRAWYRREDDGSWTRHPFTDLEDANDPRFNDYAKVTVRDIDGDGRPDVFATLFTDSREGQVYAFLAPPDPRDTWTAVQVDPGPLFGVHSQAAGSFDGTSRVQFMVGETNIGGFGFGPNPDPDIYVYRLLGDPTDPNAWERTLVDTTGTHEARAADLNGDGLPDIVGDEENTDLITPPRNGRVSWWQNTTVLPVSTGGPQTCTLDGCDDGDPCTVDTCDGDHGCVHTALSGPASVTCVCARPFSVACTHQKSAARIRRKLDGACALVELAGSARTTAHARALVRRAARDLRGARDVTAGEKRKRALSVECADALLVTIDDAGRRARDFGDGLGGRH
jgi:hypothetical protein